MPNSRHQQTYNPGLANTELKAYASLCGQLEKSSTNEEYKPQAVRAQQAIETYGYVVPFYRQFCKQVKDKLTGYEQYNYKEFIRKKLQSDQLRHVRENNSLVSPWVDDVLNQESNQPISSQRQESLLQVLADHDERSALYYIRFLVDKIEKGLYTEKLFNPKGREQFVSEYFDKCKSAIELYQRWQLTVDNPKAVPADSSNATDALIESLQNTKQRYKNLTPKNYAGLLRLNSEQNQETQSNSIPSNFSKLQELQHTYLHNIEDYIKGKNKKAHRHTKTTGTKLDIAKKALRELLNYFLDADYSKSQLQQQLQQFIDDLPKKKRRLRKNQSSQLGQYLYNMKCYVENNFPDQKPLQAMASSQSEDVLAIINRIDGIQQTCNQQLTTYLDKDKTHNKLDQSQFNELQQQSETDINDQAYQQAIDSKINNLDERIRNCEHTDNRQQTQKESNQNSKFKQITIEQLRQQNAKKATCYDNCDEALSGFKNPSACISDKFEPEELKKSFKNIKTEQPRCPFVNYHNELKRVAPAAKSTTANKSNDNKQEIDSNWFERVFNSAKQQASSDSKLTSKNKVSNISELITVGFLNLNQNWQDKAGDLTDKALLWQQFAKQVQSSENQAEQANNAENAKAIRNSIPDVLKNYFRQINQGEQPEQLIDNVVDMVWQRLLNQGKKRWWPCSREVTKAANIFYELDNLCRIHVNYKTDCVNSFLEKTQKPNNNQGKSHSSEQKGNNNQGKSQSSEQKGNNTEELFITTWDLTDQLKQSTSMFSCFCFWKKDMATDLQKRLQDPKSNEDTVRVAPD